MPVFELRTYTLYTGKMAEAVDLYRNIGWPVLEKYQDKLVGNFTGDVRAMNKLTHISQFDDDADRRKFWSTLFGDEAFMQFAQKFRPLVQSQENQLMLAAPWGPHP